MGAMVEPWHDEVGVVSGKDPSSVSSVIAERDPAIHAVTFPLGEALPSGGGPVQFQANSCLSHISTRCVAGFPGDALSPCRR